MKDRAQSIQFGIFATKSTILKLVFLVIINEILKEKNRCKKLGTLNFGNNIT